MNERINAIDAARGFCLINIFVNHVTLGVLLEASPSKIAFCDSADIFVLLAGMSAFLAYGPREGRAFDPAAASARMWRRALTLYLFNLAILAGSFLVFLVGGAGAPPPEPALAPPGVMAAAGAPAYLWHTLTMQQSVGYSMVLRLYIVLLIVGPFYLWLAARRYWYPLLPAAAIWLASGHFALVVDDSLTGERLSMTLLPWQLIFAAGISLGAAIVQRVKLPRSPMLIMTAALIVFGGTWLLVVGERLWPEVHAWLETRNDHFWTGISKTFQSPLRLLYMGALAYLVMACPKAPLIRLLHEAKTTSILCRLGRRSLEVFAFSAVFALAIDQLLWNLMSAGLVARHSPGAILMEIMSVAAGLWLMLRIADRRPARKSGAPLRPAQPAVAHSSAA